MVSRECLRPDDHALCMTSFMVSSQYHKDKERYNFLNQVCRRLGKLVVRTIQFVRYNGSWIWEIPIQVNEMVLLCQERRDDLLYHYTHVSVKN